jgi:hypothetical protein
MNDLDRFLEFELRQMLDPVVSARAPRRRRPKSEGSPFAVISGRFELAADVEPIAVPVQPFRVIP